MPRVRSIFLSDIHLGTRACQADRLLDFLREYTAESVFLVGDIVDFWAMSRGIHWTSAQNTFVQKILRRARRGERVVLIPGNHDEALREYGGVAFGDITVLTEYVHQTADGRRFLVLHGDEFDQITRHHRWVAVLGDVAYNTLVRINGVLSHVRRRLGMAGYWSLAGYAKRRVKSALQFIFDFEDAAIHSARQRGLDGIICGHIHSAAIREVGGLTYVNCGDWVDSCTAIVEHDDGRLELVSWGAATQVVTRPALSTPPLSAPIPPTLPETLTAAEATTPGTPGDALGHEGVECAS
ncbi:UDP-2,3-diacylglucosamine diphosphatase [Rhodocyclus tenuis]|uniref:UDP-2,3-diacylglucosamine diphosphatase n=2 Tax=Rhodocyclus TaxID=1064 RepID=A0A6L5JYA2_RHOTE|nr:UDP-2,3-diacylglucosamine diphosphatase [Rhodocyclus gracilis]MQY52313.1 UDP-2,3-diacylglucosamine diphosphatase [Rhodocyclus gracilis]NJA89829.1 UDP-2,3-diacylglucosamine diphosphatase [Rhodocyclus gracilis]